MATPYSMTTHVANSYSQNIYVNVGLEKVKFTGSLGMDHKDEGTHSNKCKLGHEGIIRNMKEYSQVGFTPIKAGGNYLAFDTGFKRQTAYVTIIKECGCRVCENYPIKGNYSCIVDEDGFLVETKLGSVFIDRNGKEHLGLEQYW